MNRNFKAKYPYQKLTTDVSEFSYGYAYNIHHRAYLSPVMNLNSGAILAYNISKHSTVEFTLKALRKALDKCPKGLDYSIFVHSDKVFQYQNIKWRMTLHYYGAIQSMSRKGTFLDNSSMESVFI